MSEWEELNMKSVISAFNTVATEYRPSWDKVKQLVEDHSNQGYHSFLLGRTHISFAKGITVARWDLSKIVGNESALLKDFNKSGSKYLRDMHHLSDGKADVYAVLDAFSVNCPARQHAIKKLLCAGLRGKGDTIQDLQEASDAIQRAIQMQTERDKHETD